MDLFVIWSYYKGENLPNDNNYYFLDKNLANKKCKKLVKKNPEMFFVVSQEFITLK